MNSPKVTIIVPCYNHAQYIEQCITSVFSQSYSNIELIVINDGSKDESLETLKKLKKKYNFELIDQKNIGLPATLNKGLSRTNLGEYICLLASDDYMPDYRIKIQVEALERNPLAQICCGNYTHVNEVGVVLNYVQIKMPENNFFEEMLISNYISAPTVMIRTSVLNEVGLYDPAYKIEDWYMWLKILEKHPHIAFIDKSLAFYRLHKSNLHRQVQLMTDESLKIINQYISHPAYPLARSLVVSKHIIKSFLVSPSFGINTFFKFFRFSLMKDLFYCLLKGQGPFRKFNLWSRNW